MSVYKYTGVTPFCSLHPSPCHTAPGLIKGFENETKVPPASPACHPRLHTDPGNRRLSHCFITRAEHWSAPQTTLVFCPGDFEKSPWGGCLCFFLTSSLQFGWLIPQAGWDKLGVIQELATTGLWDSPLWHCPSITYQLPPVCCRSND